MLGIKSVKLVVLLLLASLTLTVDANSSSAIPLSYLRRNGMIEAMKNGNMEQFLNSLGRGKTKTNPPNPDRQVMGLMMLGYVEKATSGSRDGTSLPHAGCDLHDAILTIPNDQADVIIYPSCVVGKRCSGCCGHPSLECRPAASKQVNVEIAKYFYDGRTSVLWENDVVSISYPTLCECQCKVQESHCNRTTHVYDREECRCNCRNQHESTSCPQQKYWNPDSCSCQCLSPLSCGSGYRFNTNTCRCDGIHKSSRTNPIKKGLRWLRKLFG